MPRGIGNFNPEVALLSCFWRIYSVFFPDLGLQQVVGYLWVVDPGRFPSNLVPPSADMGEGHFWTRKHFPQKQAK